MRKPLIAILLALPLIGCQDAPRAPRNYPPPPGFQTRAGGPDPYSLQAGHERRQARRAAERAAQDPPATAEPRPVPAWNDKSAAPPARYPGVGLDPDPGPPLAEDPHGDYPPPDFRARAERRAFARAGGPRGPFPRALDDEMEEPMSDVPQQSTGYSDAPLDTPALPRRARSSENWEEPTMEFPGPNARYARASNEEDWGFGQPPGRRFRGGPGPVEPPPGFETVTVTHGGRERSYLIYVPSALKTNPQNRQSAPLVLVFHGGGGNAAGIARTTQLHRVAERQGFIAVYPNGTSPGGGRRLSWNAGSSPPQGYAENQNVDDVGFVRAILTQVQQAYPVDSRRIYATGFSKGGMLTYRLACEMADQFAAIAPVGGTLTYAQCQPARPVALLHIHGSNDQSVPFEGGRGPDSARMARYPSALQNLDRWRQRNHCDARPVRARVTADTERYTYQDCKTGGDVSYYLVRDAGHAWPGSELKPRQQARGIRTSQQLKASEEIWKFFSAHAKP